MASASVPLKNGGRSNDPNDSSDLGSGTHSDDSHSLQRAIGKPGPDISKTNWKLWSSEHLKSLVLKAKGGVSDAVLAFIKSTMKDTKLILVMGKSGTGKSSLLNELTGMDLHIGTSLKSGTRQYHICPAVIDNQQYLFVDTAGFGAGDLDDEDNFQNIMTCLSTLRPFVTVAGVLFVYGEMQRLIQSDLRTLRWIECFCGPQFFQNITILTTKWDEITEKAFKKRWAITVAFENYEVVHCLLNPTGRRHGATIYHHGLPGGVGSENSKSSVLCNEEQSDERGDELRDLIRRKYADADIEELQIIRELNQGRTLWDTEAAKVLMSNLHQTIVEVSNDKATLVPQLGSSKDCVVPLLAEGGNPRRELNGDGNDTTRNEQEERTMGQTEGHFEQQPDDEVKEQPKKQTKRQAKPETSWFQRWLRGASDWWNVLSEAAHFFAEARKKGYQSSNRKGAAPAPAWNPWQAARNWWNGTSA
ncbi:hypothetical protein CCHR01_19467 [Colletotrichum chrysophilum]|uniref:AIG1-type G domain-containing protein n=1 Tax=Colletotrichum chrysophilum TaxID=1836956 RepID=A0AAD8ZYX9_9PEZI|nr:hypothetical protein CCHR01_19467 [Colletotrichum chrysophilum]